MKPIVNFDRYFHYDETSPSFLRWSISTYSGEHKNILMKSAGDVAGSINSKGYWVVRCCGESYLVHRIVYSLFGNEVSQNIVDHKDGNPLNNNINNLRSCTQQDNTRNAALRKDNTSGVVGVSYHKGCDSWLAHWCDPATGKLKSKYFSHKKFGESAFKLACEHREKIIEELNLVGAGYTERHGEEKQ